MTESFEPDADMDERADVMEAIRRGLADVEAGRTLPLAEFEAAVRGRLGFDVSG